MFIIGGQAVPAQKQQKDDATASYPTPSPSVCNSLRAASLALAFTVETKQGTPREKVFR